MKLLTDDQAREAWEAVRHAPSLTKASHLTGIPKNTLAYRYQEAMRRFNLPQPKAVREESYWSAPETPEKARDLPELIAHRIAESRRARNFEDAARIVKIKLKTPGPLGFMVFGDPHIEDPGTDFELLQSHLEIAKKFKEFILAGNIGDIRNNWVGRLTQLYSETTVNSKETWKLVEWLMGGCGITWTWLIRGNHDVWAGNNDPLDWISKASGVGVDRPAGVRICFKHPNGVETRLNARHDFPGNSQFNPLHALKRETLFGYRDHIVIAGHRHTGADAGDVNGDGAAFQMVRVSGYKVSDSFRHEKGLKSKPIHPAALIIVDPDLPDTDRARAWCAPNVEEGSEYLAWKRKRLKL